MIRNRQSNVHRKIIDMAKKATKKASKKTAKTNKTQNSGKSPKLLLNPVIERDKEFRDLLPPLATDVRDALEDSIKKEGLREPLVAWRDGGKLVLIDGYNRYKFCKRHGIDYRVVVKSFNDREEVKLWMWENQESRRNMTPYQRIEVVLKFEGIVRERAKKNQQEAGGAVSEIVNKAKVDQIRTNAVLGKRAGVSYATVGKVKDIKTKIDKGLISQEELNDLREGKVTINSVYNRYKDKKKNQPPKRGVAERAASIVKLLKMQVAKSFSQSEDCTLLYDQILEWAKAQKAGSE